MGAPLEAALAAEHDVDEVGRRVEPLGAQLVEVLQDVGQAEDLHSPAL